MGLQKVVPRTRYGRRVATTRFNQSFNFPAPVAGLNYRNPITEQDPKDAVSLTNLIPRPYGVELRKGWRVHQDALPPFTVETLMDYTPQTGPADAKLFAALANDEIWDVTVKGAPTLSTTFSGQTVSGRVSFVNFSTDGGTYLCVVSHGSGYWTYSAGVWTQITIGAGANQIEFPDLDTTAPEDFDFITVWKGRLWFIKNDSTVAYYLPPGQFSGTLGMFDFGALFPNGGRLEALSTWTMDGGNGIDDKLVVLASGGDLLIYEGTDPDVAEQFTMVGRWFYGRPPVGRRFFSEYGGDIVIVTTRGLVFLSELLQFAGKFRDFAQAAGKINQFLASRVTATLTAPYWEVRYLLSEQLIFINAPNQGGIPDQQLVYEINSNGFAWLKGMVMHTCQFFNNQLYFGDELGVVAEGFVGDTDGEAIDGTPGLTLEGQVQTAWVPCGDPSMLKRYIMVQPYFISSTAPSIKVQVNTDWSFNSVSGSPGYVTDALARWDEAVWDQAVWAGAANSYKAWAGTNGLGHFSSLRLSIRGRPGTVFTNYVIVVEQGGIL